MLVGFIESGDNGNERGVGVLRHVLQSRITPICGGGLCWRRLSSSFVAKWHVNDYFIEKGSNTMFTSDVYPQEKNISTGLHASYYGIHLASDQSDQDIKLKALRKATYITSSCFCRQRLSCFLSYFSSK